MSCCVDAQTNVGLGEVQVARNNECLTAVLGSCTGVAIYDPQLHIGGLAHVILPDSRGKKDSPGNFADTAVPHLIRLLQAAGAKGSRMVAKIVGGAKMFSSSNSTHVGQKTPRPSSKPSTPPVSKWSPSTLVGKREDA